MCVSVIVVSFIVSSAVRYHGKACFLAMHSHKEDWKRIRSAIGKQVIPRRVGNLTAPLCDITDDLMENLKETMDNNDGRIEDIMAKMTLWAFQSEYIL